MVVQPPLTRPGPQGFLRRLLTAAAILVALTVGLLSPAAAAQAQAQAPSTVAATAAQLQITQFDCDTGASRFFCVMHYSGGTGPFTIRWRVNNVINSNLNDREVVQFGCRSGAGTRIGVEVRDSQGFLASITVACQCSLNQQ
ncbi:hypothetical protein [Actinoplanes palleronii]|uniref:Ig-like domain-containing protein n=2 Tax=Actinoplanes palleronii TaxID=113570 RepID=A0ABQ4BR21_9ACTN|nr:hypothetical protein Apa02nite_091850 [Actinoplanes palleronii]